MGLERITDPDEDVVDLEEAKLHLKCDLDVDDDLIRSMIDAARDAIETFTGRALVTQTWQLTIDYDWPDVEDDYCVSRIVLPRPPLAAVTSVKYIDLAGDEQTLAADQYIVRKLDTGEWAIEPAYLVIWPIVQCRPAAITVVFSAGAAVERVPPAIKQAFKLLLGHFYENRSSVNLGNIVTELPLSASWLLEPHRLHPSR